MFPWTGCGAYQQGVLGMSSFVFFPYAFVNLLNPIYAYVTAMLGRNIFWADGSYTNLFGKTKAGNGCEGGGDKAAAVENDLLGEVFAHGRTPFSIKSLAVE